MALYGLILVFYGLGDGRAIDDFAAKKLYSEYCHRSPLLTKACAVFSKPPHSTADGSQAWMTSGGVIFGPYNFIGLIIMAKIWTRG